MLTTRICLVRHGETQWNVELRLQGHEDIPLNAQGLRQATATAAALVAQRQQFAAMYCSDLSRAHETARCVSHALGLPARFDERLRERHFGALQGLTRAEADLRFPLVNHSIRSRDADLVPPGGGETLRDFAARVVAAMEDIAARHPGEHVLVITHGGCLDIMYRQATSKPLSAPRDFPLGNASLNWISHGDGRWHLSAWDEREHLVSSRDDLRV